MKQTKKDTTTPENKDMMKEKTNQDFNKQKPDPKDPNQKGQNNEAEMEKVCKGFKVFQSTLNPLHFKQKNIYIFIRVNFVYLKSLHIEYYFITFSFCSKSET